jgi:hypothetical protein
MKQVAILMTCAAAALLSACGSGGSQNDDVTPPPVVVNEVPASALASASAYTNYAKTLSNSDSAEPVNVNNVATPPASETEVPLPI